MEEESCNSPSGSPSPVPSAELPNQNTSLQTSFTASVMEARDQESKTKMIHQEQEPVPEKVTQYHPQPAVISQEQRSMVHSQHQESLGSQRNAPVAATHNVLQANRVTKTQTSAVKSTTVTTNTSSPVNVPQPTLPPALKNGISQQNKVTSQSPTVSSTVNNQCNNTSQDTVLPAIEKESFQSVIPRMIDGPIKDGSKVKPKLWTPQDVALFLKKNDCGAYCDNFISQVCVVSVF